jgi:hypothetical protein
MKATSTSEAFPAALAIVVSMSCPSAAGELSCRGDPTYMGIETASRAGSAILFGFDPKKVYELSEKG